MKPRSERSVINRGRAGEPLSIEAQLGRYIVPQDDGCWVWIGKLNPNGYGQMPKIVNGTKLAHRWVYETCFGPVPPRRHVHHRCGNRACCNPLHLVALSPADHGWAHQDNRLMAKGQPER
jgi:hypothetical protein